MYKPNTAQMRIGRQLSAYTTQKRITLDKQHLFTKVWFHGYIIWWKKYELHEKIMKYQSRAPHRDIIALLYQGKTGLWQY